MRPALRTALVVALVVALILAMDVAVVGGLLWHLDAVKRDTLFGDGDSVVRGLGDPTVEQYLDEMRRRMRAAYPAVALALVVLANLLIAARRRARPLAAAQWALIGYVAVVALYWNPTWHDDHDTSLIPPAIRLFHRV